jgi:hypothetical protein
MGLGGFSTGFTKGYQEEDASQTDQAFKLKLMNAQIEGQMNAQKSEMDYRANLENASPEATQDMADENGVTLPKGMRANKQDQAWWTSQAGSSAKLEIAKAKLAATGGKNKSHMIDTGNGFVNFITGPDGSMVGQETLAGSPKMMMKAREANKDFGAADSIISLIENGTKQLQLADSFPKSIARGASLSLNQYSKQDPNAAAFMATIVPHAQRLEKLLIGTGRLTDQQIQAMQKSLPTEYDTFPVAMDKVRNLRSLFEATRDSSIKAYLAPMKDPQSASDAAGMSPNAVRARADAFWAKKDAEKNQTGKK